MQARSVGEPTFYARNRHFCIQLARASLRAPSDHKFAANMTSAHPASCSLLPHLLLALIALFANASAFDPTHVHLLDSYRLPTGQTNLLYRGGTPLNGDNFDTQALIAAMTTVASAVRVFVVEMMRICLVRAWTTIAALFSLRICKCTGNQRCFSGRMIRRLPRNTLSVRSLMAARRPNAQPCLFRSLSLPHIRHAAAAPTSFPFS